MYMSLIKLPSCNTYEQHQAIWTLFPNTPDRKRDHLFRIESDRDGEATALLQSSTEPKSSDKAKVAQSKPFNTDLKAGGYFKFKLVACPTKRLCRKGESKKLVEIKDEAEQVEWLHRKLDGSNVTVTSMDLKVTKGKQNVPSLFVTFEGILQVIDAEKTQRLLVMGIGRKKHAGAGLLSLSKAN
ncbi:MAG: type I-E CRISPR-associated protein Cas6/Cse3/CasE [Cycloclasticus sp.]|nr:MAG: type I-E CRISPR-associated protein Cas6/Cse3/CasE [Cycloclasticus sp.]